MTRLLTHLILLYRSTLGRFMGGHCRFHPTCSEYMRQAVEEYGAAKGVWMGLRRLGRCHRTNDLRHV